MPGVGETDVFSDFRVSLLDELWLAMTGSRHLSSKFTTNQKSPRAGQRPLYPRGKVKNKIK